MYALARHVTGDGWIVRLTRNFVDFIDKNDTFLGFLHIVIRLLQEACEQTLHVLTHITRFGQHRSIHDGERHLEEFSNRACKEGLARTCGADENDVGFLNLHSTLFTGLQDTFIVVIYRHRQIAFGIVLTDDILVKESLNLSWLGQRFKI